LNNACVRKGRKDLSSREKETEDEFGGKEGSKTCVTTFLIGKERKDVLKFHAKNFQTITTVGADREPCETG